MLFAALQALQRGGCCQKPCAWMLSNLQCLLQQALKSAMLIHQVPQNQLKGTNMVLVP